MKRTLKYLYGLFALALGIVLSVFIVSKAISHDIEKDESIVGKGQFPDYVELLNTYYQDFDNRSEHFHQTEERHFLPMDDQEGCLTCHSIWPHKQDRRTRAFHNQHSRFMSCMVCHTQEEAGRRLGYEWYNFGVDNSITRGGPYGLIKVGDDDVTGDQNYISKIVPVVLDASLRTRIFTPYNTPMYVDYREAVMNGESVNKEALRREAEAMVSQKAKSCSDCHSESTEFPWVMLGFEGERLNELQHSAVVGMVEKYELFYFPSAFE